MRIDEAKDVLKNRALNKLKNGALIYQIVETGCLDKTILKLNDNKKLDDLGIKLDDFINYFNYFMAPLNYKEASLVCILRNADFLLSNKYHKKNYNYIYQKIIVSNFVENMRFLYDDFKEILGGIKNINLNNKKQVEKIFTFLRIIVWSNYYFEHVWNVLFYNVQDNINDRGKFDENIFRNKRIEIFKIIKNEYRSDFEKLLYNYQKNKDIIIKLLEYSDSEKNMLMKK